MSYLMQMVQAARTAADGSDREQVKRYLDQIKRHLMEEESKQRQLAEAAGEGSERKTLDQDKGKSKGSTVGFGGAESEAHSTKKR